MDISVNHPVEGGVYRGDGKQEALAAISQFLVFKLDSEEYGIDIRSVQEIRYYETPTHLVNTPVYVRGVVNLRGTIVPVLDLRVKFDLGKVSYDDSTLVIVINIGAGTVGLVVDGVSDVVALTPEQLCEAPDFCGVIDRDSVLALGSINGRMLILLDIEKFVSGTAVGLMRTQVH